MYDPAQLRLRGSRAGAAAASGAGAAGDDAGAELPNPLTMRAVGEVFKRRWAVPMTVAVVCLAIHFMGLLDDPNAEPSAPVDHQVPPPPHHRCGPRGKQLSTSNTQSATSLRLPLGTALEASAWSQQARNVARRVGGETGTLNAYF